jgi:hypothetical protein
MYRYTWLSDHGIEQWYDSLGSWYGRGVEVTRAKMVVSYYEIIGTESQETATNGEALSSQKEVVAPYHVHRFR